MRPRRRAGFTLIELLVVLSIIAVLASIAYPIFRRTQVNARASACVGNLRNLGIALNLYLQENNEVFPTLVAGRADKESEEPAIDNVLDEYTGAEKVFRCPGDNERIWEATGTSYFWNSTLNGQHSTRLNFMGVVEADIGIPVISDKENFHPRRGDEVNILYADGHVDKEVKFSVGP